MANTANAMTKITNGDFENGFQELAQSFSENGEDEAALAAIRDCLLTPNVESFTDVFNKNVEFLNGYPYIFTRGFSAPDSNRFMILPINETVCYCYDSKEKTFFWFETNSDRETRYFFENLDKPVFVKNEFNEFNLNFLEDNVRDSRDFAGDNHIYLWYENAEMFSLLLYYVDLKQLFEREKFVVLIGEEREKYPIDFKAEFGIDYDSMTPQKIRIEEIKRICYWVTRYNHGLGFICDVLSQNKNIFADIMVENYCLVRYKGASIWLLQYVNEFLKRTGTKYSYSFLENLSKLVRSNDITFVNDDPSLNTNYKSKALSLIDHAKLYLNKPEFTFPEFIRACILCMYYENQPKINSRITPLIFFLPDWTTFDGWTSFVLEFPYHMAISSAREPVTSVGQIIKIYDAVEILEDYDIMLRLPPEIAKIHHAYKFEDLKLYPKETIKALCRYMQVPYDPKMSEDCPINGLDFTHDTASPPKTRFDTSTLHRNVDAYLSKFDQVRLQIFFDPVNRHYDYPSFDFESCPMTEADVAFLMKFPFKFENHVKFYIFDGYWIALKNPVEIRKIIYNKMMNAWLSARQGQFYFPPIIRPEFDEKKEDEK